MARTQPPATRALRRSARATMASALLSRRATRVGGRDEAQVAVLWTRREPRRATSAPRREITDANDARLADYRALKERHLNEEGGRFVAEGERVVRRLLASRLRVRSIVVTEPRLRALADALSSARARDAGDVPVDFSVFVVTAAVLDTDRRISRPPRLPRRSAERPAATEVPADARGVVVLEISSTSTTWARFARNAAAFGADALVLSPRCADPFYRKASASRSAASSSCPS